MPSGPYITIDAEVIRDEPTDMAILIHDGSTDKHGHKIKVWVPRSHISSIDRDDKRITMTEWIATEKGLI